MTSVLGPSELEELNTVCNLIKNDPELWQKFKIEEAKNGKEAVEMVKNCQCSCSNPKCTN